MAQEFEDDIIDMIKNTKMSIKYTERPLTRQEAEFLIKNSARKFRIPDAIDKLHGKTFTFTDVVVKD